MPLTTLNNTETRMVYGRCDNEGGLTSAVVVPTPIVRVSTTGSNARQWEGTVHGGAALVTTSIGNDLSACSVTVGHPNGDAVVLDGASNIQFVDTGTCFQTAGKLTGATFTAGRAVQDGKKFQVYRVQSASGHVYTLVGETEDIEVSTAGLTHVTFAQPLVVHAGDCIGWRHDGVGVVKFSSGGSEVRWLSGNSAGVGNTMSFKNHGPRTYAYSMDFLPSKCTNVVYTFAKLDASNVLLSAEHEKASSATAETMKACLVDGSKDSDQWQSCPHYDQPTCDSG